MLYSPWLRLGEETFKTEYDPEAIEAERFENSDNKVQGQLREIRKILGTRLANEMSSETWIAKAVSTLNSITSKSNKRLCSLVHERYEGSAIEYSHSPSSSLCWAVWNIRV
jgi:hypothetical protein